MRIGYADIVRTVKSVESYAASANGREQLPDIEIVIENDPDTETFTGPTTDATFQDAMPIAHTLHYAYVCSKCPAINRVDIDFEEWRRRVEVTGLSRSHVRAAESLLSEELRQYESGVTWSLLQNTLMSFGAILMLSPWFFLFRYGRSHTSDVNLIRILSPSVLGILLFFGSLFAPWRSWFPGVSVFAGSPSPLVRYAPQISFAGLLLTALTSVLSMAVSTYLTRRAK
jgi:hypothetical protein